VSRQITSTNNTHPPTKHVHPQNASFCQAFSTSYPLPTIEPDFLSRCSSDQTCLIATPTPTTTYKPWTQPLSHCSSDQTSLVGKKPRCNTHNHPQHPHHASLGLARTVYIYTVYDRTFGDFPAKNTVQHAPGPSQPCCAGKLEAVHLHPQPPTTTQVPHLVLHNHTVQGSWKQCTYTHNHPQPPTARTWSFTTIMRRVA
jgi:hypothetical protein